MDTSLIIISVCAVIALCGVIYVVLRNQKIRKNGIETDAVISCVKEVENRDADGHITTSYQYFVRYQMESGEIAEAQLANPPRRAAQGMELRIKYLPEKPKLVIAVK